MKLHPNLSSIPIPIRGMYPIILEQNYTNRTHCTSLQLGRKTLLLLGALGMMSSMLVAGTLVLVFKVDEGESQAVGYIVLALVTLFVVIFSGTW